MCISPDFFFDLTSKSSLPKCSYDFFESELLHETNRNDTPNRNFLASQNLQNSSLNAHRSVNLSNDVFTNNKKCSKFKITKIKKNNSLTSSATINKANNDINIFVNNSKSPKDQIDDDIIILF